MRWIKKILGINEIIDNQKKTIKILHEIATQTRKTALLQEKNNKANNIN